MNEPGEIGLVDTPGGCRLRVRVVPRSSANRLLGTHDDALKVALTAPPVEGAANKALLDLLSAILGIPRSQMEITAGDNGRLKTIAVCGLTAAAAFSRIKQALPGG